MPRVTTHRRRGLTLLEVIISVALIGMLMGAMVTFFWQVVEVRDTAAQAADRMQIARQVLARIEAELRSCIGVATIGFPIEQPLVEDEFLEDTEDIVRTAEEVVVEGDDGFGGELTGELADLFAGGAAADPNAPLTGNIPLLIGNRRNITFLTARLPAGHQYEFIGVDELPPPAQHDLTQVSYWLWVDPEDTDEDGEPIIGGIMRTEKKTLNQFLVEFDDPLDVRNDLWSPELGYLEFRYFDGVEWDTVWDVTKGNSLPQLIQVTVGFGPCTNDELEDRDLEEYPLIDYPYGDDRVHRDRYSIIVRIPAADKFFSSRVNRQLGQGLPEQLGFEEGF
jgi:prepilin-type N-terminal cleavage/methylation domain-containing protein